ncbi:YolD-like family protein [Paenibacillus sp. RC67]|uniref:YolD-like family protein n=1 Tax=Paenibacillus sp. RC67 TaxID=3039392 RepID=UPI0024ADC0FA|nr:YolD-like family protein [Paenibacillus sp. RC67]
MKANNPFLKLDEPTYINKQQHKRKRPEKDEQELESLIRTLAVAIFTERENIVTVWSEYEDQTFRGKITELDKVHRTIRIENEEEYTWIQFDDVMDIEIITSDLTAESVLAK